MKDTFEHFSEKFEQMLYDNILPNSNEWDILHKISNSQDPEFRLWISEFLANYNCSESERILINLSKDSDKLVRASACDSLSGFSSPEVLQCLCVCLTDKSYLVRGYAALSVGDFLFRSYNSEEKMETLTLLKKHYKKEKSSWTKINIMQALVKNGDYSMLPLLSSNLYHPNYQIRCLTVNLLGDLYSASIKKTYIIKSLRKALQQEKSLSVKKSIEKILMY